MQRVTVVELSEPNTQAVWAAANACKAETYTDTRRVGIPAEYVAGVAEVAAVFDTAGLRYHQYDGEACTTVDGDMILPVSGPSDD
jgi:hypothetical protein